jgi:hypothetical protein
MPAERAPAAIPVSREDLSLIRGQLVVPVRRHQADPFVRGGTDGSNPLSPSGESGAKPGLRDESHRTAVNSMRCRADLTGQNFGPGICTEISAEQVVGDLPLIASVTEGASVQVSCDRISAV